MTRSRSSAPSGSQPIGTPMSAPGVWRQPTHPGVVSEFDSVALDWRFRKWTVTGHLRAVLLVEWSGGATGLDQWLPVWLPFRASWQMAFRSCPRFLHPLLSFRTAGLPQDGWKPAWSLRALPPPSPAAFDAEPAFLSASGSESGGIGSRLCPQALGSARFIMSAPANATTA